MTFVDKLEKEVVSKDGLVHLQFYVIAFFLHVVMLIFTIWVVSIGAPDYLIPEWGRTSLVWAQKLLYLGSLVACVHETVVALVLTFKRIF